MDSHERPALGKWDTAPALLDSVGVTNWWRMLMRWTLTFAMTLIWEGLLTLIVPEGRILETLLV